MTFAFTPRRRVLAAILFAFGLGLALLSLTQRDVSRAPPRPPRRSPVASGRRPAPRPRSRACRPPPGARRRRPSRASSSPPPTCSACARPATPASTDAPTRCCAARSPASRATPGRSSSAPGSRSRATTSGSALELRTARPAARAHRRRRAAAARRRARRARPPRRGRAHAAAARRPQAEPGRLRPRVLPARAARRPRTARPRRSRSRPPPAGRRRRTSPTIEVLRGDSRSCAAARPTRGARMRWRSRSSPPTRRRRPDAARLAAVDGDLRGAVARWRRLVARLPLPEYAIALGEAELAAGAVARGARGPRARARASSGLLMRAGVNSDAELAAVRGRPRRPRARRAAGAARLGGGAGRALGRRARLGADPRGRAARGRQVGGASAAPRLGATRCSLFHAGVAARAAGRPRERAAAAALGARARARRRGRGTPTARRAEERAMRARLALLGALLARSLAARGRGRAPARQLLRQPPLRGVRLARTGWTCDTCSTRPRSRRSSSAA